MCAYLRFCCHARRSCFHAAGCVAGPMYDEYMRVCMLTSALLLPCKAVMHRCSGVRPRWSCALTGAPFSIKNSTTPSGQLKGEKTPLNKSTAAIYYHLFLSIYITPLSDRRKQRRMDVYTLLSRNITGVSCKLSMSTNAIENWKAKINFLRFFFVCLYLHYYYKRILSN